MADYPRPVRLSNPGRIQRARCMDMLRESMAIMNWEDYRSLIASLTATLDEECERITVRPLHTEDVNYQQEARRG